MRWLKAMSGHILVIFGSQMPCPTIYVQYMTLQLKTIHKYCDSYRKYINTDEKDKQLTCDKSLTYIEAKCPYYNSYANSIWPIYDSYRPYIREIVAIADHIIIADIW